MRRSTPWIYRWSRPLIGAIALVGITITAYLSLTHVLGQAVVCPTQGCEVALNSTYSEIFGIPLALLGLIAYISMALLAWVPLAINGTTQPQLRQNLETGSWWLLLLGGTVMVVCSGYLMTVLLGQLQVFCLYCIFSALCSALLFGLTLAGRPWPDLGQVSFRIIIVGLITLVTTVGLFNANQPNATANPLVASADSADSTSVLASGPAEIALAAHLQQIGARMYGAYWCPHCQDQKALFGQPAIQRINYIECDAQGPNAQPDQCRAANIKGFPTWEIGGQQYSGTRSLQELAELSGYQGPQNFVSSELE